LKLIVFSWRDLGHPRAGGSEIYLFNILRRLDGLFDEIICFTSNYLEARKFENLGRNITIYRVGYDYTPPLIMLKSRKFVKNLSDTIILENINHVPFYTPILYPSVPIVCIIHHIASSQLYIEAPVVAPVADLLERGVSPIFYRDKVVIAPSQSTATQLARLGYRKVYVVPPGIEYGKLRLKAEKYVKKPNSIIYFGRIMRYKQIHHVIKALAEVVKEIPDVRLTIAGRASSKRYLRQLYSLIRRLNLRKHVAMKINVSEEEKIRLLAEAEVYVTASAREGWAITIIEANACGTPAVGYDVPGLRDSIRHGKTGLLVRPGNISALARGLVHLLTDEGLKNRLSKNALKWSRQFSWDKTVEKVYEIFCKSLNKLNL